MIKLIKMKKKQTNLLIDKMARKKNSSFFLK